MEDLRVGAYGDVVADVYDDWFAVGSYDQHEADAAAVFLAAQANGGRALELGIGTGRVALPLSRRGIEVHGVEASELMVAKLRAKPGGAALPVTIGNFVDVAAPGQFDLIYIVFNTLFFLTRQEEQVRCLGNVRDRLRSHGRLVVQAFVPNPAHFQQAERIQLGEMTADQVRLDFNRHDPVGQTLFSQRVVLAPNGTKLYPMLIRYIWPSELDLMCRLHHLRLVERVNDWGRQVFDSASSRHVSVYEVEDV
ncbi:class I SAM-dependent methyltransferase [Dactylosporangium sp. NPDC051485]|uniref:class I SAM-dependent DNA methyltransferase n=1 Tax=Dactylosporangium sp. NPDC051485 TaxID=3154846 RepID=UPI003438940B